MPLSSAMTAGDGASDGVSITAENSVMKSMVMALFENVTSIDAIRELLKILAVIAGSDGIAMVAGEGIIITMVIMKVGGALISADAIAKLPDLVIAA